MSKKKDMAILYAQECANYSIELLLAIIQKIKGFKN